MCVSSSTSMSELSNIKEENFNRYFISDSPILNFVVGAISKSISCKGAIEENK